MFILLLIVSIVTITAGFLIYSKDSSIQFTEKKQQPVRISIIIPARNEENNIPVLLESIKKQSLQPHEVIVADDGSTDRTAEVASSFGAKVLTFQKEEKWIGKTFGCWSGAKAASGDYLIFIDADTWFADSDSLKRVVSAYQDQGSIGMLSIQPYHAIKRPYENFSLLFNILVIAGMNVFSFIGQKINAPRGFGPFLFTSKEDYFQTDGHKGVRGELIEGIALGKNFQKNNLPVHLYSGEKTIHFQMYPENLTQLMNGWTKHFATGSKSTHPIVMSWIVFWISGGFLIPGLLLLTIIQQNIMWIILASVCYFAYSLQFYILARRTGRFSIWTAVFFPVMFLFFVGVFIRSWIATNIFKRVEWKGQKVDL